MAADANTAVPTPGNAQATPNTAAISAAQATPPQTPATLTPLTEQALERGKQWLAAAPDSNWFLQLYAVDGDEAAKVEEYLRRLGKDAPNDNTDNTRDNTRVYASDLSGRLRYGVVYGDYADRKTAEAAASELPDWVRASRPYARQVKRLR